MKKLGVGVLIFFLATQPVWAARTSVHQAAESAEYGRKFGGMIGRGVLNVATCFVDLLVNVVNETRSGPPLVGTLVGLGKGTGCTGLRVLSGGVDLITFWVPGFNGFPVSDSYENCLAFPSSKSASSFPVPPTGREAEPTKETEPATVSPSSLPAPATPRKEDKPRYTK